MNSAARLQALSAFLKSQRAKISPESVGLPAGTRRRTPGLRREEVAQLAGVSTTWYTWLEQGRDIQASPSVLDCVAAALRMNADERKYLYSLASDGGSDAHPVERAASPIPPSLQKIIGELTDCPVIVSDRTCHIVAWNRAASFVFLDFERIPAEERNMIRLLFERREFRRLAVNWTQFAGSFLSLFRSYYGRYVGDGWYDRFLQEMMAGYPEFREMWEHGQVSYAPEVHLEFRHAKAGRMVYELTSLSTSGQDDLRLSIYTPASGTSTEAKLRRLMDEGKHA
ncbi:helix-turn-helix transcriptional regulator [Saccharibacillus deserti]|uniref:helix-turn-helix transcriptional regulator n=1 Tax=Saccharibacillus deserti TaxID=1634444 RepID=UPI001555C78C|nr:helix-turn-helix transcriptional regulator [Saccharibacillus deserti]